MAREQPSSVNAGNIENFSISSNQGSGAVDLSPGVTEFRYYESVLSNTVTATAAIVETGFESSGNGSVSSQGLLDGLPIRGGERTDISIVDSTRDKNKLTFTDGLYVNRVRDGDPGTSKDVYFLDFSSKEFFGNDQTRVTKRYEGRISDNVEKILRETLKTNQTLNVDSTAIDYNFYGNDRKPFYICTWLASKSVPQLAGAGGNSGNSVGGAAGYLFYQTRDSLNFKSIDMLLSTSPVKKYIYTNTVGTPEGYDGSVLSYSIERDIDLHQNLSLGTYNNRTIFYDPVSFNYVVKDYNIAEQDGKISTAGKSSQEAGKLVSREFIQSPSRLMSSVLDIGYNPPGSNQSAQLENWSQNMGTTNFDGPRTMVQSVMRYNQLFTIQTNITIAGDFSIRAGDMIQCDFPELKGGKNTEINKQSSGSYLVAHVCHRITPSETFTTLSLVRDSYGRSQYS